MKSSAQKNWIRASALIACGVAALHAQNATEIERHITAAKAAAGTTWAKAAEYFCAESAMPNRPTDPAIAPTRLFDNLSVIGSVGTAMYVLETSQGLILIDAGYPGEADTVLIPGLKALGFDPAKVRYMLVAHGHSDHYGAARQFQKAYGTKVFLTAADWALVETPQPAAKGPAAPAPERDQVIVDRQPITLGDAKVTPVAVPGHTPGAVAFLFTVRDRGQNHTAGLFGGTVLSAGFVSTEGLEQYVQSVPLWAKVAAENHVTVEIQNHPLMDGFVDKLQRLKTRGAGDAHPFVVGERGYAAFMNVIGECAQAQLARRKK
jgi:metallo-beta-lactamase class B